MLRVQLARFKGVVQRMNPAYWVTPLVAAGLAGLGYFANKLLNADTGRGVDRLPDQLQYAKRLRRVDGHDNHSPGIATDSSRFKLPPWLQRRRPPAAGRHCQGAFRLLYRHGLYGLSRPFRNASLFRP